MVATERSGRETGRVEASGQESAVGRAATLQAVTRVKPEQASKVKSWMPTRLLTGEGRADGEETDKHLFDPPGYWVRHVGKVVWVIGGDPGRRRSHLQRRRRMTANPEVGEGHGTVDAG
jgi:hypothetical protein